MGDNMKTVVLKVIIETDETEEQAKNIVEEVLTNDALDAGDYTLTSVEVI